MHTYKGAVFTNKVACAIEVNTIEECHKTISVPKHNPGILIINSSLKEISFIVVRMLY